EIFCRDACTACQTASPPCCAVSLICRKLPAICSVMARSLDEGKTKIVIYLINGTNLPRDYPNVARQCKGKKRRLIHPLCVRLEGSLRYFNYLRTGPGCNGDRVSPLGPSQAGHPAP